MFDFKGMKLVDALRYLTYVPLVVRGERFLPVLALLLPA
jgi:hypothetical protein